MTAAPATAPGPAAPGLPGSRAPVPLPAGTLRTTVATRLDAVRVRRWVARGLVKVLGNVEVTVGDLRGTVSVGGSFSAQRLDVDGTLHVAADLGVVGDARAKGTTSVGGALTAGSFASTGRVEVTGPIRSDRRFEWRGELVAGSDLTADEVVFSGRLSVPGTVSARSFAGTVNARSTVGEIHADWVDLQVAPSLLPVPIPFLPPPPWRELEVARIEATEAHLAGVRAYFVKADRVWLGPDSHVQYLEGDLVERHKSAHLGPESESPPPPGLSR